MIVIKANIAGITKKLVTVANTGWIAASTPNKKLGKIKNPKQQTTYTKKAER